MPWSQWPALAPPKPVTEMEPLPPAVNVPEVFNQTP